MTLERQFSPSSLSTSVSSFSLDEYSAVDLHGNLHNETSPDNVNGNTFHSDNNNLGTLECQKDVCLKSVRDTEELFRVFDAEVLNATDGEAFDRETPEFIMRKGHSKVFGTNICFRQLHLIQYVFLIRY